jgi:GTPase Era involved in 16S rRNA processing
MKFQLRYPSISEIRAKFIIDKLASFPTSMGKINIFATGRTGSGKTTLGNRLLGINYFMPSSGHQDCTNEVNLIEFPIGLNYFDIPGVCSDDKLENYNRVALGLKQIEDFPKIENLTVTKYIRYKNRQREIFQISEFNQQKFSPDIILYLIAPDKQFLRADCIYLQDLLHRYSKIIYVLNMFAAKENSSLLATSQNISDVIRKITKVHTSVLGNDSQPVIVQVNCWTGEGISELVGHSRQMLEGERGKLFEELIYYQNQRTPDEYINQVKREILKIMAYAACQKPDGTSRSEETLRENCLLLWEFLSETSGKAQHIPSLVQEVINAQINAVINKCTEHHYEKVTQQRSKAIYKSVPVFKTISEQVTDYSRPIKETRTVWRDTSNVAKGLKNLVKYGHYGKKKKVKEIVGYHKKAVNRQVLDGYREEYSHTEYWQEETGEVKHVGTTYHYFQQSAVSLLLTLAHLFTSENIDKFDSYQSPDKQYQLLHGRISSRVNQLPKFPNEPTEEVIFSILEAQVAHLFEAAFKCPF